MKPNPDRIITDQELQDAIEEQAIHQRRRRDPLDPDGRTEIEDELDDPRHGQADSLNKGRS